MNNFIKSEKIDAIVQQLYELRRTYFLGAMFLSKIPLLVIEEDTGPTYAIDSFCELWYKANDHFIYHTDICGGRLYFGDYGNENAIIEQLTTLLEQWRQESV